MVLGANMELLPYRLSGSLTPNACLGMIKAPVPVKSVDRGLRAQDSSYKISGQRTGTMG